VSERADQADRTADPFALPSLLWLRFLLMAATILAVTADLADTLIQSLPNDPPNPAVGTHCWYVHLEMAGSGPQPLPPPTDPTYTTKYFALVFGNAQCFVKPNPLPISPELAGAGIVVALCAAIYLLTPTWRVLRSGLIPVRKLPGIGAELEELARLAGVRVRFTADVLNLGVGGLAFGRVGRRYVVLNRGLLQLAGTDRAAFRAVVLHELAHVRNQDLDVSYLTVVLWRVFLAVVLLPTLILFHGELDADSVNGLGQLEFWAQLGALALVVLVLHHAILRERELRADIRAAGWSGDVSALLRVLDAAPVPERRRLRSAGWLSRPAESLQRTFRLHPSPEERRLAVAEPGRSPAAAVQGFALGLAFALTWTAAFLDVVEPFRAMHLIPHGMDPPESVVPGLIVITASMGLVLSFAVWRAVLVGPGAGGWGQANRLAAAVCAGLLVGDVLNGQNSILGPEISPLSLSARATWWALLVVGTWVCIGWFAVTALAWRSVLRRIGPGLPTAIGTVLGAALFGGWLGWVFSLRLDENLVDIDSSAAFLRYAFHSALRQAAAWPGESLTRTLLVSVIAFPALGLVLRRAHC